MKKPPIVDIETMIESVFMSRKNGIGQYSDDTKAKIENEHEIEIGVRKLNRKYGISRDDYPKWCRLCPEVDRRHATLPTQRL